MTDPADPRFHEEYEKGPWMVVIGTLWDGFEFYGPFKDWDAANNWADGEVDVAGFIVLKEPPSEEE